MFKGGNIWGNKATDSAIQVANEFKKLGFENILIPGIGYGRNAKPFSEKGIHVSGIEISRSAIKVARANGFTFPIYHGSVLDMPYGKSQYDGIYCYALLHLFDKNDRLTFIKNCYNKLNFKGQMVFVVVSPESEMFGEGIQISKNQFKLKNSLNLFFYDTIAIEEEFEGFGLIAYNEIDEPIKHLENEPPLKCFIIRCGK